MGDISLERIVELYKTSARFVLPRESYLPPEARGTEPYIPPGTDMAVWKYEHNGTPYAVGFLAKQNKPFFNYRFRSEDHRDRYIEEQAAARRVSLKYKSERDQARKDFRHDLKVGDILYSSWGYDQTNVDFYQVTKVFEGSNTIEMREIDSKVHHSEETADYVVAIPNDFVGPAMKKRVSPRNSVKITSYSSASKWDGKPKYQTGFGYGH